MLAVLCLLLALGYTGWRRHEREIHRTESAFGAVRVTERGDGLRSLYLGEGRARQSAVFVGRPRHLELAYTRVAVVGLALVPPDARILYVGLGGGAMPMHARAILPDAHIEVVEIDPAVVEVARRWFGFRPDPRLVAHVADGRAFIERAPPRRYHLIVLDAFSDDEIPAALATRQFLEAVRERLAPGGVVVSNLWTAGPEYRSMLATYHAVFPRVHLARVPGRAQVILLAARGDRRLDREAVAEAARALARRTELGFDLPGLVERGYAPAPEPDAPVLEDPPGGASGAAATPRTDQGPRRTRRGP